MDVHYPKEIYIIPLYIPGINISLGQDPIK